MFRVGQKVVCVNAEGTPELTLNAIYTITAIDPDAKDGIGVELAEVEPPGGYIEWIYDIRRFRPIVERKTNISVFTEMLKTKKSKINA
jgi:hypothetical protein